MKNLNIKFSTAVLFVFITIPIESQSNEIRDKIKLSSDYVNYLKSGNDSLKEGRKQYLRSKEFFSRRFDESYSIESYAKAIYDYYKNPRLKSIETNPLEYPDWSFKGPIGIPDGQNKHQTGKGWIWCLSIDPSDHDHIYAGSHNAGLWETEDGGASWTCLTDQNELITGVISVVVDYSNDYIYIATALNPDTQFTYSFGLFKSTDNGSTWFDINNDILAEIYKPSFGASESPRKLIMHPDDSDIIYFITQSQIFKTSNASTDCNWELLYEPAEPFWQYCVKSDCAANCGVDVSCAESAPDGGWYNLSYIVSNCCYSDPDIIACLKDCPHAEFGFYDIEIVEAYDVYPERIIVSGHIVLESIDEGDNWDDITEEISDGITDPIFSGPLTQFARCEIGVDNVNYPNKAWFLFCVSNQGYIISADFSDEINTYDSCYSFSTTDLGFSQNMMEIEISPNRTDGSGDPILYISGVQVYEYNNSTTSKHAISDNISFKFNLLQGPDRWVHSDIRYLKTIDESGVDFLFTGHDGGVSIGEWDGGLCSPYWSWRNISDDGDDPTDGLQVTEFYGIAGTERQPELLIGGTQDNSVFLYDITLTGNKWRHTSSGDGAKGLQIDFSNSNHMYALDYFNGGNGRILKSGDKGRNFGSSFTGLTAHAYSPLLLHPNYYDLLYVGERDRLGRFTNPRSLSGYSGTLVNPSTNSRAITAIEISPVDEDYMYIANDHRYLWSAESPENYEKCIWYTSNLLTTIPTWHDISSGLAGLSKGFISDIEAGLESSSELWISL